MKNTLGSVAWHLGIRQATIRHFCKDFKISLNEQFVGNDLGSPSILKEEFIEFLKDNLKFLIDYELDYYSDKTPSVIADTIKRKVEDIEPYLIENYPEYYEDGKFVEKKSYSLRYISSYKIDCELNEFNDEFNIEYENLNFAKKMAKRKWELTQMKLIKVDNKKCYECKRVGHQIYKFLFKSKFSPIICENCIKKDFSLYDQEFKSIEIVERVGDFKDLKNFKDNLVQTLSWILTRGLVSSRVFTWIKLEWLKLIYEEIEYTAEALRVVECFVSGVATKTDLMITAEKMLENIEEYKKKLNYTNGINIHLMYALYHIVNIDEIDKNYIKFCHQLKYAANYLCTDFDEDYHLIKDYRGVYTPSSYIMSKFIEKCTDIAFSILELPTMPESQRTCFYQTRKNESCKMLYEIVEVENKMVRRPDSFPLSEEELNNHNTNYNRIDYNSINDIEDLTEEEMWNKYGNPDGG